MNIGILGSRGIPNNYGGFEQFAEVLSVELVKRGHVVTVYCSSQHPNKSTEYKGVKRIIKADPATKVGGMSQYIYDFYCLLHARKQHYDVVMFLGYVTSAPWLWLLSKKITTITNMDGLEWQREKYCKLAKIIIRKTEKYVARKTGVMVADSTVVKNYLKKKYHKPVRYIPYGAKIPIEFNKGFLNKYALKPNRYFLAIARFEPENNLEMIIRGYLMSASAYPLIIVGNTSTNFGKYLTENYCSPNIIFAGEIFKVELLNALRHFSLLYFHGHSAGGTNPSLLEAIAAGCKICAHDNEFNREVLQYNAIYFSSIENIVEILTASDNAFANFEIMDTNNQHLLKKYSWDKVIEEYEKLFLEMPLNKLN